MSVVQVELVVEVVGIAKIGGRVVLLLRFTVVEQAQEHKLLHLGI